MGPTNCQKCWKEYSSLTESRSSDHKRKPPPDPFRHQHLAIAPSSPVPSLAGATNCVQASVRPVMRNTQKSIDAAVLEQSLALVRSHAAGAEAGVFGPNSQIWRIDREAAVFLGAGRALLMQLAHPWVATAIAQHSTALGDPIGRFHRTFQIVFTLVFGSLDQALSVSRRLHLRHAAIFGSLPEPIGPYPAGSRYRAN